MPAKILIIDDHEPTRSLIESILSRQGYYTVTAPSGAEGLEAAAAEDPDLVLLDLTMPGMNGYEVCRHLRAQQHNRHTPIIMFTAKSLATDKLDGFNAGADDYLTKPTSPGELLRRVATLLRRATGGPPAHSGEAAQASIINQDIEPLDAAPISEPIDGYTDNPEQPASASEPGCLLTIIGARGGCGTTTLAINLAATLAAQGRPTTLVDLDMNQGHVSVYLKQKLTTGLNSLAALEGADLTRQVGQELLPLGDNLRILLCQPNLDGRLPLLYPRQVKHLLQTLRLMGQCVVVDAGRGLNQLAQAALSLANEVLLCSRPERVSLTAAKQLLPLITSAPYPGRLNVILMDFRERSTLPQSAIEHFLAHEVRQVVRVNDYKLAHAVNSGLPLVHAYPDAETMASFRQLCRHLALT